MTAGRRFEGKHSFTGQSLVAKEWEAVLKACLAEEADKRYQDALFLKNDLAKLKGQGRKKGEVPSLTVVVAGAMERLGVTHTAIGLTAWLNRRHPVALYRDETEAHVIEIIAEETKGAMERQGVIQIGDFLGMPSFGSGVVCETEDFPVHILDIGSLDIGPAGKERREKQKRLCMEADAVLLLIGGREWEMRRNLAVLTQWDLSRKPIILFPFGATDSGKRLLKERKVRKFYTIPCFHNLWKIEKEAAVFYQKLWERITGKGGVY